LYVKLCSSDVCTQHMISRLSALRNVPVLKWCRYTLTRQDISLLNCLLIMKLSNTAKSIPNMFDSLLKVA